ncbi:hypothetical protein HMPREF0494_0517 [Limosilactobacillus antri DSM 16041]|uniref:Uncharacterized protein n=1 Tax=Limosilactobacillus antri DSM 16041 TaxID=525309 RepID=C8P5C3_9LACO|nr:hypothetical protein HMPREF0494_0517 [Limosilactobacillus antri DSM 16041]KRK59922.1 hypothetical protein FC31_GL000196 [Limosilactobacillus antri DSM 16041]
MADRFDICIFKHSTKIICQLIKAKHPPSQLRFIKDFSVVKIKYKYTYFACWI